MTKYLDSTEELEAKALNNMSISTKIGFKIEYDVNNENCRTQELYKAIQTSCVEMCNFVLNTLISRVIKELLFRPVIQPTDLA